MKNSKNWLLILFSTILFLGVSIVFYININSDKIDHSYNPKSVSNFQKSKNINQNSNKTTKYKEKPITRSQKSTTYSRETLVQDQKYGDLDHSEIKNLFATDLSAEDRNYLEHKFASQREPEISTQINEMLEDGFMDLSIEMDKSEVDKDDHPGAPAIAVDRMNSAIRIAGLREDKTAVRKIIDLATHFNSTETTLRAAYEALGYIGGEEAITFLSNQFDEQTNPFLKSELILSLTTAGDDSKVETYLKLLYDNDTDLKNSAIVALGELKADQAIDHFRKIFKTSDYSSQVLMIQASYKIDTPDAGYFLNELSKTHKKLVENISSQSTEETDEM